MGVALGVDGIIMPHAARRRKYTAINTVWEGARAETLWDVESIRGYAAGRGLNPDTGPKPWPHPSATAAVHHVQHSFGDSQV